MMTLVRVVVACAAFSLLGGCAQQKDTAAPAMLCNVCVVSGEPLEADAPTSDYMEGKVGFCCTKCQRKWDGMSDADKKMAVEKCQK